MSPWPRIAVSVLVMAHSGHAVAQCTEDSPALQARGKCELWKAATVYRSKVKALEVENLGLKAKLAARTATVASAIQLGASLTDGFDGPEPAGLGDNGPGLWVYLAGVATLAVGLSVGLFLGSKLGDSPCIVEVSK